MRSKSSQELISRKYDKKGLLYGIWQRMRTNPGAVLGLIVLAILMIIMTIGIFTISYESITKMNPLMRLKPPSDRYWFGTDELGRDLFLRIIYGLRYSYSLAVGAIIMSFIIGTFFGSLAGYFGGRIDTIIMRTTDTMSSVPTILLGMVIVSVLGPSVTNLLFTIGITSSPMFVRMSRASVLTVRGNEYIEAAQAIGMSNFRIVFTQALPNALSPLIVTLTSRMGSAILQIASLSFLGFGLQVPLPELGALVSGGRNFMNIAPHITLFPGLFIVLTTFSFAMLGDGLRDALDPRLKK
jgi:peptide/nickel transport system permease protein